MTIPLPQYAKIKDNYCLAYFGHCKDYLVQMRLLRPVMEQTFPGVRVYLACHDEHYYVFQDEPRLTRQGRMETDKHKFAYVRELTCDMRSHPVESFMKESDIPIPAICNEAKTVSQKCVILTNGFLPTKPMSVTQVQKAVQLAESRGYYPVLNETPTGNEWVIGVECEQFFEAAARGCPTSLVVTGFGENLYKRMFPSGEILNL